MNKSVVKIAVLFVLGLLIYGLAAPALVSADDTLLVAIGLLLALLPLVAMASVAVKHVEAKKKADRDRAAGSELL